ncbi:MAG: efflux RND transporter permease subunit [Planctomycetes bacterium]|nr:efflux RND transporter permease subunit [Planctomycetota bacterium]
MFERVITWSVRRRGAVLLLALAAALGGAWSLQQLDIDAFPDTTPVQVQINAVAPAMAPEQIEQQITARIEYAIAGLPGLLTLRSVSKFGWAQVVATFHDDVDVWFARRQCSERLASVVLPPGIDPPELGPVATGLGEVLQYVLSSEHAGLEELRTAHDWIVRPALRAVPGVAEVNTWGGLERQYVVRVDPRRLVARGITLAQLTQALRENNVLAGGGNLAGGGAMVLVQGIGSVANLEQIGRIVVAEDEHVPILVDDVATVEIGAEIRRGAVTHQGAGEAVLGLGFMLAGENTHEVTSRLKAKLAELALGLPDGMRVQVVYDRTQLVDLVIDTVSTNLFEGGLLVIAVLFVFLGHLRAGLIVAAAIPLSMLFAFAGMFRWGIAGSLMSLGAIDFGLIVDSSVIQIENVVRRLSKEGDRPRVDVVRDAVLEVRKPTMFGELIIALVYVPILLLEGVEGKLFRPMALTVIFALAGSLILSLTVMPALAASLLRHPSRPRPQPIRVAGVVADATTKMASTALLAGALRPHESSRPAAILRPSGRAKSREPWAVRASLAVYRPVLRAVTRHRLAVIGLAIAALGAGAIVARGLGAEFVPRLSEGTIGVNVVRLAGTDLAESVRYNTQMERALLAAFPDEIEHVWSRAGSAEVTTDPMGVELTDLFITLRPRAQWRRAARQDELAALVQRELRDMPGQRLAFQQPIEMRMAEMTAGVRGDVAVKVFGDDLATLAETANQVGALLGRIDGAADLSTEQVTGQPVLAIRADQEALARHGVPASAVMAVVEALGSSPVGEVVEGQLRFPLVVRLVERDRRDAAAVGAILVAGPDGMQVPLAQLTRIEDVVGPSTISREAGQRQVTVQVNVRGRDIAGFVAEARETIAAGVAMPSPRYRIEWGGQFEHFERARTRLLFVVPAVLLLIAVLLWLTYRSVRDALRVFTGVPFAVVGGVIALWVREMPFSISAAVGFVALSGVAVLGDMVLVSTIRQLRAAGVPLAAAVETACLTRLRPVLMTALVAALGFVPMAFSQGVGAEVQRPLATVVLGGVLSSTLLTLLALPAIYLTFTTRTEEPA